MECEVSSVMLSSASDQGSNLFRRYRANMAHIRQSRPYSGLGFLVKVQKTVSVVASSLESGPLLHGWSAQASHCLLQKRAVCGGGCKHHTHTHTHTHTQASLKANGK